MLKLEVKDENGREIGVLLAQDKVFKSGSTGYYAFGKIPSPEGTGLLQCSINLVLIGSKDNGAAHEMKREAAKEAVAEVEQKLEDEHRTRAKAK